MLWAAVAGIGFGLFQSTNRAALRGMDPYASTFLQLALSVVILAVAALLTEDLGLLAGASASAWWSFTAAGLVHFSVGWTLLNLSQQRLGAARTSPLLATTPLFGVVIAALTLHELPGVRALGGVALIVVGVYAVELDRLRRAQPAEPADWAASLFGLGTALCWAVSPILVRHGLRGLPSPLLGVTIGMVAATLVYGLALGGRSRIGALPRAAALASRGGAHHRPPRAGGRGGFWGPREALAWKLAAGVLVGVSTWSRWYSVALVPVAVVLGLGLLSVPTVLAAAPLLVGRQLERITPAMVAGSALVLAGALVLIAGP